MNVICFDKNTNDIKDSIIGAASDVFKRYGFKKTTIDQIALTVKKGKSSLYYYFKSKEEMFEAVVQKEFRAFKKSILKAIIGEKNPVKKLHTYFNKRLKIYKEFSNLMHALTDECLSYIPTIEKIKEEYNKTERIFIEHLLKEGKNKKAINVKDSSQIAAFINQILNGIQKTPNNSPNNDKKIKELSHLILYGII